MRAPTHYGPHPADRIRALAVMIDETLYDMRHRAVPVDVGDDRIHMLTTEIATLARDLRALAPSLRLATTLVRCA